jgi:hypothetical protein
MHNVPISAKNGRSGDLFLSRMSVIVKNNLEKERWHKRSYNKDSRSLRVVIDKEK